MGWFLATFFEAPAPYDMTGGASGGAWYRGFDEGTGEGVAMSINSYGYSGTTAIYGPKFDSNTQAVFEVADSGTVTEHTIVP